MDVQCIFSRYIVDIALGMYVYTYPEFCEEEVQASVPRPWGFKVFEIVNGVDLEKADLENPEHPGNCDTTYVYVVEKVNVDSLTVCRELNKLLGCSRCELLGLKDAEALARQVAILRRCSRPMSSTELMYRNGYFKAVLWSCTDFLIHVGNRFYISIVFEEDRDVKAIQKRLESVQKHGYKFLNFFGYQRFGTRKPVTHLIGKLLLKKEWPLLVDLMCRLRSGRASETPEGKVCSMWLRYNDYVKAVKSLPKEYLILYINAYQSYIFNVTLSMLWTRLVERYGVEKAFSYLEDRFAYIPVPGLRTPLVQEEIREIVDEVLEIEGIDQEDFRIEPLGLAVRGDTRRSLSRAYDVKIWFGDREMNLSFVLDRGCYATVFVRELLRTNPLRYT